MMALWNYINQIHWRESFWLLIGFQPVFVDLLRHLLQKRQYVQYAENNLLPWVIIHSKVTNQRGILHKLFSKNAAYVTAWILLAVAAAGPRIALEVPGHKFTDYTDIMLVVDISRSMQATDLNPNRLRRAQIEISELLERAQGNRMGIIVFAARAHLYVPLSSDYSALRFYLKSLDELILPTMGSQPAAALKLAYQELKGAQNTNSSIILISDGDWHDHSSLETQQLKNVSAILNQEKIPVNVLAVATNEGSAVPLTKQSSETGWLRHQGQSIVSRMDESKLRQLAKNTGGHYSPVYKNDRDWATIYDKGILKQDASRHNNISDEKVIWHELYSWALAPAILFLWISLIPYGLQPGKSSQRPQRVIRSALVLILSILILFIPIRQANADELENNAYEAYVNGQYDDALTLYKGISGYIGRLGEGTSLYQLGDYKGAVQQFTQSVLDAKNDSSRATGLYNLGNSYFKIGDYRSAVTVYKDALTYHPNHEASRHNLLFSEALLKEIVERQGTSGRTNRIGSGPSQSQAENGLVVSGQTSISVDDSQEKQLETFSLPELPGVSQSDIQNLVNKGLAYIKLADDNSGKRAVFEQRMTALAQSNARIRMKELEDRQSLLWKRLFEIEEGFAAPQDKPSEIPGIAPW